MALMALPRCFAAASRASVMSVIYVTVHQKIDHNAAKIVLSYCPKQPAYAHTLAGAPE